MSQVIQAEVPWSRLENEPELWYGRFVKYAKPFGYEFTPERAYRMFQYDQSRRQAASLDSDGVVFWAKESERWEWKARAKYSADEEAIVTETIWRQRQLELLERDWELGNRLRGIVETVVDQYLVHVDNHKEGNRPSISMQHVVQAAKLASDTQRITLAMPTEIIEQRQNKIVAYLPEVEDGSDTIFEQHSNDSGSNGDDDSSGPDNRKRLEAPKGSEGRDG